MNPTHRLQLLLLSLSTVVAACGGGGGGDGVAPTVTPTVTAPVTKTYRQQALGLLKGNYQVSCAEVGKTTAPFPATVAIDDEGQLSLTAKGTVNFNALLSVYSISASYPQDGIPSSAPPGIAFLGKSGTRSVGMNFDPSDPTGYELSEFFFQEEEINSTALCVPTSVQPLGQVWAATKLIDTLTQGINAKLPCANGGFVQLTKTLSSLVIDSGNAKATVNLAAVKLNELLQLPTDQALPGSVVEDNLTYTATYLDGSKLVFDLYVLGGIKRINLRNGFGVNIVDCS